jgi:putative spermidine/putrescine transport system permease protein
VGGGALVDVGAMTLRARSAGARRTGAWRRAGRAVSAAATALVLVGPLVALALGALSTRWFFPDALPRTWTLEGVRRAVDAGALDAVGEAFVVGAATTVIALVLAWPAARVLARSSPRLVGFALGLLLLPSVVPSVSLATGVDTLLLRLGWTGTRAAVVLAHLVPTLPYALAALTAVLLRHDERIEHQARVLGASPLQVWRLVTVRALSSGVAVAAALSFLVSWSQYLLTLLVGEGRVVTVSILLANAVAGGNPTTVGVLGLATALPAVAVVLLALPAVLDPLDAPGEGGSPGGVP